MCEYLQQHQVLLRNAVVGIARAGWACAVGFEPIIDHGASWEKAAWAGRSERVGGVMLSRGRMHIMLLVLHVVRLVRRGKLAVCEHKVP